MAITRTHLDFEEQFTRIPNDWARDETISLRARGLLALLMSHRPGWRITIESLVASNPEGRDSIRSAMKELQAAGYLRVAPARDPKTGRMHGQDYTLADPRPTALLKTRTTGSPPQRRLSKKEDLKALKLNLPIEHTSNRFASQRQIAFLKDIHIILAGEIPDQGQVQLWEQMTSAEAHEEIRWLWSQVEEGGDGLLHEIFVRFGDQLSEHSRAYINGRLVA